MMSSEISLIDNDKYKISIKINEEIYDEFPIRRLFFCVAIPLGVITTIFTLIFDEYLQYIDVEVNDMDYKTVYAFYQQIVGNVICFLLLFLNVLVIRRRKGKYRFNTIYKISSTFYMVVIWINIHTLKHLIQIGDKDNYLQIDDQINNIFYPFPFIFYFLFIDKYLITNVTAHSIIFTSKMFSIPFDALNFPHIFSCVISSIMLMTFILMFYKKITEINTM